MSIAHFLGLLTLLSRQTWVCHWRAGLALASGQKAWKLCRLDYVFVPPTRMNVQCCQLHHVETDVVHNKDYSSAAGKSSQN